MKTILNNTKLTANNEELLEKYSEKVIYFADIHVSEIVKNKYGYKKTITKKLKDEVFCEFRFKETIEYFENHIKFKLNIKKEKLISVDEIFLKCVLGHAYIRNN